MSSVASGGQSTRSKSDWLVPRSCSASNSGGSRKRSVRRPLSDRKLPTSWRAGAEVELGGRALERSVAGRDAAGRLLIQARLGDDANDQAVLVAELGRRHAGDDLHRLHGLRRDLVRVDPALLVGHRLVVDRKLRLRVIADRMEEPVGVGDHARRGQRDHLVQARRRLRAAASRRGSGRCRCARSDRARADPRCGRRPRRSCVAPASASVRSTSIGTDVRTSTSRSSV